MWPCLQVTDVDVFAGEVLRALEREKEDGTTPVHELFERVFEAAVEDGCEGVDYDESKQGETPDSEHDPIDMRRRAMGAPL